MNTDAVDFLFEIINVKLLIHIESIHIASISEARI